MNQLRILNNNEKLKKNEIEVKLNDEYKLAFKFNVKDFTIIILSHIEYYLTNNIKFPRKKSSKIVLDFMDENYKKINKISLNYLIKVLENIATGISKNVSIQEMVEIFNQVNLEYYILSFIIDTVSNEVLDLLKEELK